jgi:uncharacterized membrane protein
VRRILTVVIGFAHDFAAGIWAATVLAVWWIHRAPVLAAAAPVLSGLMRQFFWIGCGAVVVVMATGAGRTFTYVDGVYGEDAERARRRALVVKHVVLGTVFGLGTWWMGSLAFR